MDAPTPAGPPARSRSTTAGAAATVAAALAAVTFAWIPLGGCTRASGEPRVATDVEALGAVDPPEPPGPAAGTASPPSTVQAAGDTEPSRPGDDLLAVVDGVLARYGDLLDELSADPAGAPPPGSTQRARWDEVVLPGSALSEEVLARLHRRAVVDRVVVGPGADGVAFRHHALRAETIDDDHVGFSWCGWAPGIARSIDTGDVVDDLVANGRGRGALVRAGDTWQLASLEERELTLLDPGSADPCTSDGGGPP